MTFGEIMSMVRKAAEPKWIVLVRHSDGEWTCGGMEPVFKPEAKRIERVNRIIGGITNRIFPFANHPPCSDCRLEEVDECTILHAGKIIDDTFAMVEKAEKQAIKGFAISE